MNQAIRITDALGGTTKAAEFFGIHPASVSEWRANGRIPRARERHLRDIRPDLFAPALDEKKSV